MPESPLGCALRRQREAATQGFDWPDAAGLWAKLAEEIAELQAATTPAERCEELGDLLFMVVNIARHLEVDAEAALAAAISKFDRRYADVMRDAECLPPLGDARRLHEMERRWQDAKRRERTDDYLADRK